MQVSASAQPRDDLARARQATARACESRWPGAQVVSAQALTGDASARRYVRCQLDPHGTHAPASCIVMLTDGPSIALSSEELGVFGQEGPQESPFLNIWRFLSARTEAVPDVLWTAPDSTAIVLEDVGDLSLWEACRSGVCTPEEGFTRALDLLAELQDCARDDGSGCYAFLHRFDEPVLVWEFEHFLEYGLRDVTARDLEAARSELERVARRIAAHPTVFCHRDFHAWNLHVDDGRLRLFDFQDALMGPAYYDVASLLTDRSTPELVDEGLEKKLIERFAATLASSHPAASSEAHTSYKECAFHRACKVVGRFHYLSEVKKKPGYLRFLPAVIATARRFASLLPELETTARLLAANVKISLDESGTT